MSEKVFSKREFFFLVPTKKNTPKSVKTFKSTAPDTARSSHTKFSAAVEPALWCLEVIRTGRTSLSWCVIAAECCVSGRAEGQGAGVYAMSLVIADGKV